MRLNQFQRTMLQWSEVHPYHAIHILKVGASLSRERFEDRLNLVLEQCGLAFLTINEGRGSCAYAGGNPRCRVREVAVGGDPMAALEGEIVWQLNEPIAPLDRDRPFTPFRFFLMNDGAESYLGIAYFHAVADAETICRLLHAIARAAFSEEMPPLADLPLSPTRGSSMPTGSLFHLLPRTRAALRRFQSMRRSIRPPACQENEFWNAYFGIAFDNDQTKRVLDRAREWGVTVNDLCLAALLKAISANAAQVRNETHRTLLSVGCVVNARRSLSEKRRRDFGLFLGSFAVTEDVSDQTTMRSLAQKVSTRTLAVKQHKLYLAAPLEFMVSRFMFGRMPLEKKRNFYRKSYPLWGAVTNVNLGTLGDRGDPSDELVFVDYFRAVSAGPAMPLVIGVTGVEGHLNFGISFRPNVLSEPEVRGIVARFTGYLTGTGETA